MRLRLDHMNLIFQRQATEWHTPYSPTQEKNRRKQGKLKLPMISASDIDCGLAYHRRETGQTVNGMYCKGYIQKVLRRKHPELLEEDRIILHDNAVPHISERAASLHAGYKWETPHSPNSLDLSPCDFDLSPKLKKKNNLQITVVPRKSEKQVNKFR